MGSVRRFEEVKHAIGVAAIIGALTGGMGGFLKGVEILANPFVDMAIKEVIEGCVATKAGTVLRSLEAIGLPPEERLAYIYDWKTLALDFGLGTLIGIGLGSAGIAFRGAAGEAVERAAKEGMEDTLEGAGDAAARVAKEGIEDTLEGAGDAAARTVKEGTEGVLEDTTERAAKEGLESGSSSTTGENSRILSDNLAREGRAVGEGEAAAHIVASTGTKRQWASAADSRALLTSTSKNK